MTTATTPAQAKKDIQKLQRTIVDALEDVKAVDIQVYDTEAQTALFERVIVASGTSNRQTKALAASVVDAVREAGFGKPRIEGEQNGEWIIVDCGSAVLHIMQPAIRQYYHLEDLWGDKPVRIKFGAAKPVVPVKVIKEKKPKSDKKAAPEKGASTRNFSQKTTAKSSAASGAIARKAPARKTAARPASSKAGAGKTAPTKTVPTKTTATKTVPAKRVAVKTPIKRAVAKVPAKKTSAKKA